MSDSAPRNPWVTIAPAIATVVAAGITAWGTIEVKSKDIEQAKTTAQNAADRAQKAEEAAKGAKQEVNLRVAAGTIGRNGDVRVRVGRDFAVTPTGKGKFRITFPERFDHKPAVVAQIEEGHSHIHARAIDPGTVEITFMLPNFTDFAPAADFNFVALESVDEK